jgi:hypothetical protein
MTTKKEYKMKKYLYKISYNLVNGQGSQVQLSANNDKEAQTKFNNFVQATHGMRGSIKPVYEKSPK